MTSLLFTEDAQAAFEYATLDARKRHTAFLDIENLLLGVLQQRQQEPIRGLLSETAIPTLIADISNNLGMERDDPLPGLRGMSKDLQMMMGKAAEQARQLGHNFINSGHLLLAMFDVPSVQPALERAGLHPDSLRQYIAEHSPKPTAPSRVIELHTPEARREAAKAARESSQPVPMGIVIALGMIALSVYLFVAQRDIFISFWLVLLGWILSVSVHEFAHAIVAYWGGDYTVKDKGYLTFNPLRYTHPLISIGLPLLFLLLGGLPLPGGAVYIERHRLRNKWWGSAVSAAGPAGTLLMAIIYAAPFWLGIYEYPGFGLPDRFISALAFLVQLEVLAFFFNLLPLPPLDGFGIIEPFLSPQLVMQVRSLGFLTLFLIFYLFRLPVVAEPFWETVDTTTEQLSVEDIYSSFGYRWFFFWEDFN